VLCISRLAPRKGWAGLCGVGGRGVTNGIKADPHGCAYGSVCGLVGFFEEGGGGCDIRPKLDVD